MNRPGGLTAAEAARQLREDGPNELAPTRGADVGRALVGLLREPLFLLLFVAAALYLALGERNEALALVASTVVAAAITLVQQVRTERVLASLRELAAPRALVQRDGQAQRVAGRDVVRGDLLLLREGDRIAADATVAGEAQGLLVDESLLTGESAPVHKFAGARLYANTLVAAGQGQARVTATGARTEFGLIGGTLASLHDARSPLQRDTARLARGFGAAGLLLSLALALGWGAWRGQWVDGVLRGLTLAMAILPEEFPLVITVFMALGAWRLARLRVLTRRPGAIEALGSATVLCVDKTGTLTANRMVLARALPACGENGVAQRALADCAALACEPAPFDPMERATLQWAAQQGVVLPPSDHLQRRYPLREDRLVMGHAWRTGGTWRVAAKGAPEHVLPLCRGLAGPARAATEQALRGCTEAGLRVLAVAHAVLARETPPDDLADVPLQLQGLVAFQDPLRPEVPAAVADCRRAGIRLLMITGDHPHTAAAIAREAGWGEAPQVVTGAEVEQWSDAQLAQALPRINVVARARPLVKLRLVQALQGAGEVVAMTGDGVNDAPALRAAHIGVAMGGRGSDVAREAASLVLLDDDFGSLVAAVRQGRRIFANLRQALLYVLAVHVPTIGVSLLPLLLGTPPMLLPLHIMFLEFVIDPACSLAFEAEDDGTDPMDQPPRGPHEHVLGRHHIVQALLQGGVGLAAALGAWALAWHAGAAEPGQRSAAMTAIVAVNLLLILHERTAAPGLRAHLRLSNHLLWGLLAATVLAWATVLGMPTLRGLFRLAEPTWSLAGWVGLPVLAAALVLNAMGRVMRR